MKEDNPFNRFDSKPSSDSKNPFDQFDAPSAVAEAAPAVPKERGTYEKTKEGFLEVLPKNSHLFLGPMVVGGVGELLKGGGAAIELVAPETGKKVREYGRGIVGAVNERYPISGTIGEIGSYALPYGLATKGIQALRGAPAVSTLGRAAEAGGAGGAVGYATTGGDQSERILSGALGSALGSGTTLSFAAAQKGYAYVADLAKKAFAGDAKKAAKALRDYGSRRTGAERKAAEEAAKQAEQTARIAETAEQKAMRQQELAYRDLPGTKTEKEAGRFKPIPTSEQAIGDRIRGYVDKVFNDLKAVRSKNAETLKSEAFDLAKAREQQGVMPKDTGAFRKGMAELDSMIDTATLSDIKAPLQRVRNALDPVKGKPVSFEGLEQLRRFLRDRSYGLPAEGFDAIGQQQAGQLAKIVESIQREFTSAYPTLTAAVKGDKSSAFDKFLAQYRKDSEPLQVFRTKTGKLFEEQLPGVEGYAKVSSKKIPSKVFADRESYQGLIEAVGGNRAFAENEARKYFAGQMEKLAGDPKELELFIRNNRTMLNLTNARDMVEAYAARARIAAQRGVAAGERAAQATEAQKTAATQSEKYKSLNLEFRSATDRKSTRLNSSH